MIIVVICIWAENYYTNIVLNYVCSSRMMVRRPLIGLLFKRKYLGSKLFWRLAIFVTFAIQIKAVMSQFHIVIGCDFNLPLFDGFVLKFDNFATL